MPSSCTTSSEKSAGGPLNIRPLDSYPPYANAGYPVYNAAGTLPKESIPMTNIDNGSKFVSQCFE